MVEEIRKRVKTFSASSYAPWFLLGAIIVCIILTSLQSPSPVRATPPPDLRTMEYWQEESELRAKIDRNLQETKRLLVKLVEEMDAAGYDAGKLLARIKEKRQELRKLLERLEKLKKYIARRGKKREDGFRGIVSES